MRSRQAPLRALLLLLLTSCGGVAPPHDGPVVLITFDSLRADVVGELGGEPGLTPNLDALLRRADWAGRAIAPSSWGAPSMASLFTGLRPWQHQVLRAKDRLSPALVTLPEALRAQGYETFGFSGEPMYSKASGYDQGFDSLAILSKGAEAAERLKTLGGGRQFVWVHIPEPAAPYFRRPKFSSRLSTGHLDLPLRMLPNHLALYFDPATPLPPAKRRRFWTMYRFNVAWADERLGRLLAALRQSGEWDRTLLVVTSTHGEEFGEKGQILNGGNLGRQLLEVPFAVKLPAGFNREIAVPKGRRVSAARLWATLVEAAGGEAPPAVARSLFRSAPGAVLSELYLRNGTNQFSLVEGDEQLLWESRFAPSEPEYYRARLALMHRGNARIARAELTAPPSEIFGRLLAGFLATPPLTGRGEPRLTLERWEAGGSRPVSDPRRTAELARLLARTWGEFVPAELPPGSEVREWYTAESP
ncbi:MAG TPA: sulfatase [Thermoanaerobaculia bacterium]